MDLVEAAEALGGELHGSDARFTGVSTDTRAIQDGELFVALEGPNFDGHKFVSDAMQKHAAAALVSRRVSSDLPQVTVTDTRESLGRLAEHWRDKFQCPIVAVTGSNGKTTVKEMIGSILRNKGKVLVSTGNLNNDIGLPLVLCRLSSEHDYGVVEMGMNHAGEISYLSGIAKPSVAVVTNAAPAHLEGLGTVEAVAHAKGEIFEGLASDGVAVINADDQYAPLWQRMVRHHNVITFGLEQPANVTADDIGITAERSVFKLYTPIGACDINLALPGRHNVMNALAAAAAAIAAHADLDSIKNGLDNMLPISGRLQTYRSSSGARIVDDSYNANPKSMLAAINVLAACEGTKILVAGDMKELGESEILLHTQLGEQAKQAGIDRLMTFGDLGRYITSGFGEGATHFSSKDELTQALASSLNEKTTVLVKGSRGVHMEDVVRKLAEQGKNH